MDDAVTSDPAEQRNPYQGSPPRPWIVLRLMGPDGATQEFKVIADTGNPFAFVIGPDKLAHLHHGEGPQVNTNFGPLEGAWFQLSMPELGLTQKVFGYASAAVVLSSKASHPDFEGLAGLPLLRLLEYGGNPDDFWIRLHA